ncbi:MAG TPA: hypothetical protein VL523_17710 [Terriglobia bacterium]|nr:hypothetical protein [Terriglobia bacterium]
MLSSTSGAAWTRIVIIQLVIIAALAAFLTLYLPGMTKRKAAAQASDRERRIQLFAKNMLVQDPSRQVSATGADGEILSHPQKLLQRESVDEVQQALGAPTAENADVNSGQHLIWTGTRHQLQAAFNKGLLYNVMYSDMASGHGVSVFESSLYWQAY